MKRKRKAGSGSRKGFAYERELCTRLSLWWTGEERDDIFWRTAGSGGRATNRRKKNKSTAYQDADMTAIDPRGEEFVKTVYVEMKKGYPKASMHNMFDRLPSRLGCNELEQWIDKANDAAYLSGRITWFIIHRHDGCQDVLYMPLQTWYDLRLDYDDISWMQLRVRGANSGRKHKVVAMFLVDFFALIDPYNMKAIQKIGTLCQPIPLPSSKSPNKPSKKSNSGSKPRITNTVFLD